MKFNKILSIIGAIALVMVVSTENNAQKKATAKPAVVSGQELLEKAHQAMKDYDFDEAASLLGQYRKLPEKSRTETEDEYQLYSKQLQNLENAFERVEKIIVIDSISVDYDNFFQHFKLPKSAGRVVSGKELEDIPGMNPSAVGHINEAEDYVLWSYEDDEDVVMKESMLLLNGEWITEDIEIDSPDVIENYGFPFISQDGQTIYFSAEGEGSMGGRDIFLVQRDPITGEFLNPLNMGMPYNSPYEEVMMVLDEENGIGWWVTGRNGEDEALTVYAYLINDVRQNYPSDEDDLEELAKLTEYQSTWPDGQESKINDLLKNLPTQTKSKKVKEPDFELNMGRGKIYRNYSDFRNKKTAAVMKEYLTKKDELEKEESGLKEMRRYYTGNKKNLADKIIQTEEKVELLKLEVEELQSQIFKLEKSVR